MLGIIAGHSLNMETGEFNLCGDTSQLFFPGTWRMFSHSFILFSCSCNISHQKPRVVQVIDKWAMLLGNVLAVRTFSKINLYKDIWETLKTRSCKLINWLWNNINIIPCSANTSSTILLLYWIDHNQDICGWM